MLTNADILSALDDGLSELTEGLALPQPTVCPFTPKKVLDTVDTLTPAASPSQRQLLRIVAGAACAAYNVSQALEDLSGTRAQRVYHTLHNMCDDPEEQHENAQACLALAEEICRQFAAMLPMVRTLLSSEAANTSSDLLLKQMEALRRRIDTAEVEVPASFYDCIQA